jgi:ABC-type amino acid transport substrate-binding protein
MIVVACGNDDKNDPTIIHTSFRILDDVLDATDMYGIGFRKDDIALGLEVQKHLDAMITEGKASEISMKWFNEDLVLKNSPFLKESIAPADDKSLEKILEKGELGIAGMSSAEPFYFSKGNNVVGFDVDMAQEVAKRMGVSLKFNSLHGAWGNNLDLLNEEVYDCIWSSLSITNYRKENMFFGKAYMNNRVVVVVPSTSTINNISDLEEKTIGLLAGSSHIALFQANPVYEKAKNIVEKHNINELFIYLQTGKIDAWIMDESIAKYFIAK